MKILQVITGLQKAAGTTVFLENVVRELRVAGADVDVFTCASRQDELEREIRAAGVVHIHGLWSPLLHRASTLARKHHVPVVWSTHGMTAPWSLKHKWWKKCFAWWLYQKRDLKSAAAIHCTTDLEVDWNRKLGFKNCFVAPLGTELKESPKAEVHGAERGSGLKVLFVGRIYPVKGLMNVVRAAALVKGSGRETASPLKFRIVGPDQAGHLAELQAEARRLGVAEMFDWAGPKYGDELATEYDACDLLILNSFTENFGGVVVDALAHGKPVIASRFTPWDELERTGCGWWIDNTPESVAATLRKIIEQLKDRTLLSEMGARGRKLVEEKYQWSAVARTLMKEYGVVG